MYAFEETHKDNMKRTVSSHDDKIRQRKEISQQDNLFSRDAARSRHWKNYGMHFSRMGN